MISMTNKPRRHSGMDRLLVLCVSSAASNIQRRKALRRSWFTFKTTANPWVTAQQQQSLELLFVVSAGATLEDEHVGDMLILEAAEGYGNLWRKALQSLAVVEERYKYAYYMHADDDSYVRVDQVLQLLSRSPREKFYWGYIWDGTGSRKTQPIRNPRNKSYMPADQYALDYYPPFASGCGFVLSRDLVKALLKQPLPDYRLLDPPFGIHLCGSDFCVLPDGPVKPVHDERVRPYRGIPIFKPSTIVQHYLAPEEMLPFHQQVVTALCQANVPAIRPILQSSCNAADEPDGSAHSTDDASHQHEEHSPADVLYSQLVTLGLLRR